MLKYLSYSANKLFEANPEEYFKKYFCGAARMPQTPPMAVGSAFDAYVKAELYRRLVKGNDPRMTKESLFEAQVESQARDGGRKAGTDVYNRYCELGGLDDLMTSMQDSIGPPNFEVEVNGTIEDVVLMGKPDIHWLDKSGSRVIHDFKVMGYYAKMPISPRAGYIRLLPSGMAHKDCIHGRFNGHLYNAGRPMNHSSAEWAEQLSMYAWILGEPVGSEYLLTIDQICCKPGAHRLAQHAALVNPDWQKSFFNRLKRNWTAINQGHFFLHLPFEENLAKCELLRLHTPMDLTFKSML